MLAIFEGRSATMYLDGSSNVTVAEGHLIASAEDAVALFGDPRAADEWRRVKGMAPGHLPAYYATTDSPRLTDDRIDSIRDADVARVTADLARLHPNSASWPDGPRGAACDCLYNTGKPFPRMWAAMDAGEWELAAKESHRIGIQPARNAWARDAILSAQAVMDPQPQ